MQPFHAPVDFTKETRNEVSGVVIPAIINESKNNQRFIGKGLEDLRAPVLVDQHPGFGGSTPGVGGSTQGFCGSTPKVLWINTRVLWINTRFWWINTQGARSKLGGSQWRAAAGTIGL